MDISSPITLTHGGSQVRTDNALKVELKAVCSACNNGWMSNLETDFETACGPMILGSSSSLDANAQGIAATWAIKTALLLELAWRYLDTATYAPASHFAYLYEHHSAPPNDALVWIAAVDAEAKQLAWSKAASFSDPSGEPDAYLATVAVGYLVLQIFGRDIRPSDPATVREPHRMAVTPQPLRSFFEQIWPIQHVLVSWPPRSIFAAGSLNLIFESG
jgi:hypothetical protein